ncbi:MAG: hypothetical protein M3Y72_17805 [Acidobacteriota bacterium]|nr:hypothetical protein [Acidobacteriota bacterium]
MDKLLLRAQVLQQDTLENLQRFVANHTEAIERHEAWKKEADERAARLDDRIQASVSAVGAFIARLGESK